MVISARFGGEAQSPENRRHCAALDLLQQFSRKWMRHSALDEILRPDVALWQKRRSPLPAIRLADGCFDAFLPGMWQGRTGGRSWSPKGPGVCGAPYQFHLRADHEWKLTHRLWPHQQAALQPLWVADDGDPRVCLVQP